MTWWELSLWPFPNIFFFSFFLPTFRLSIRKIVYKSELMLLIKYGENQSTILLAVIYGLMTMLVLFFLCFFNIRRRTIRIALLLLFELTLILSWIKYPLSWKRLWLTPSYVTPIITLSLSLLLRRRCCIWRNKLRLIACHSTSKRNWQYYSKNVGQIN